MRRGRRMMLFGGASSGAGVVIDPVTIFAGGAVLDGTIGLGFTVPSGATGVLINYSVDQPAAPSAPDLGILLGTFAGPSASLTGVTYGASYKFALWATDGSSFAATAATVTVVGPLNPLAYSSYLNEWLDSRRQTPIGDNTALAAPTDFSGANVPNVAGTTAPLYRTAANGLAGLPAFEWTQPSVTPRQWHAGTVTLQHATRGLTIATLCSCADAADALEKTLISRWETGTNDRAFRLYKAGGEYIFNVSPDGTSLGVRVATCATTDDTDPHGIVGTFNPGAWIAVYRDGVEDQRNTTSPAASIYAGSVEELREGGARHNSGDAWWGKKAIQLAYSDCLSPMSAIMLSDDLAAVGGV